LPGYRFSAQADFLQCGFEAQKFVSAEKLANVYAEHFRPFNVAAVSLWPGYVATERRLDVGGKKTSARRS